MLKLCLWVLGLLMVLGFLLDSCSEKPHYESFSHCMEGKFDDDPNFSTAEIWAAERCHKILAEQKKEKAQ